VDKHFFLGLMKAGAPAVCASGLARFVKDPAEGLWTRNKSPTTGFRVKLWVHHAEPVIDHFSPPRTV